MPLIDRTGLIQNGMTQMLRKFKQRSVFHFTWV